MINTYVEYWSSKLTKSIICLLFSFSCLQANAQKSAYTLEDTVRINHVVQAEMSPDGKNIAFVLNRPNPLYGAKGESHWREIYLISQKGRLIPLVTQRPLVGQITWSDDGKFVWFLSKHTNDPFISLYKIAVNGGEAQRVFTHHQDVLGFTLSDSQRQLVFWSYPRDDERKKQLAARGFDAKIYQQQAAVASLWKVDLLSGLPAQELKADIGHVLHAEFFPDEKHLLIQHAPTPLANDTVLYKSVEKIDLQGSSRLAFKHQGKLGKTRVSPDGKWLAVIGSNDGAAPANGKLLLGRTNQPELSAILPDLEGQVKDLYWLDKDKLGLVIHQGTGSYLSSITVNNKVSKSPRKLVSNGIYTHLSASDSGRHIALIGHTPEHPSEVFWYTRGSSSRLTNSNPWLKTKGLAQQTTFSYLAQDGLEIEGVLVLPKTGSKPYPLLLFVHGGPESHVSNGWLSRYSHPVYYAAQQGFASYFPNYRGSTGRGTAFSKAGQQDYAGKEFDDLVDAIAALSKEGIIDPKRVGISGASYGGYAAAWGATKLSKHFAASVASMGIGNQVSKFGTTDIPNEMYQLHALQWPWDDWLWMLQRSPIYYADQSKTPLLLLHGQQDTRVHHSQSIELYGYMKQRSQAPVRLVLYPEEGHGFRSVKARYDYSARLMRWMKHFVVDKRQEPPPYLLEHPQFTP